MCNIIKKAMDLVSKDVRLPKCVRDSIVKPKVREDGTMYYEGNDFYKRKELQDSFNKIKKTETKNNKLSLKIQSLKQENKRLESDKQFLISEINKLKQDKDDMGDWD